MPESARSHPVHHVRLVDADAAGPTGLAGPPRAESRIAELEREVDELRSANAILLSVATYYSKHHVPHCIPGRPSAPSGS
ncbi:MULTISPECIES: hypothetical protein [unclassified Streptomyces]|uniref:hypothetical protein n=1 Tax=unclassified Streptomyces TaxID=2593676 RepID=UPI0003703F3D|nr:MULTISPECIES: hypothetical protein [unclassified Streptomyces]MYT28851.1 hypothetical protein [Streptomyces sp. SID8354]